MAQVFYDNQKPVYRNTSETTSITLDSSNNQMIINNSVLGKTITINAEEFSNGVDTLTYQKMYAKINAVEASIYPPLNTTTAQFVDTLIVSDNANLGLATTSSTLTGGQLTIQDLNGAGTRVLTADAGSLSISDGAVFTTYINNAGATFSNTISGQYTQITNSAITTTDAVSYTSILDNATLTFTDTLANLSLQLTNDGTISPSPIIQMTDTNGYTNTTTSSKITFNNGTTAPYIELNTSNQLWINNDNTYPIILNSTNSQITIGDVGNAGNFTKIAIDDTTRTNEINSVDIKSSCGGANYYTLPIQFTNKANSNYTYNNPNTWEMVFSANMNIPLEQLTLTNGYTTWKMDFAINCWNMTKQTDKAYAMYIEVRDINGTGNDYTGFLFNKSTPFTTHKNASTYTATNSQIENYQYTDYFDFSGATGSPLEIRLWRYADNTMSCDFGWLVTLSKNNLV